MSEWLGQLDADESEGSNDAFADHRSGEDDRLPAQTFFELLSKLVPA